VRTVATTDGGEEEAACRLYVCVYVCAAYLQCGDSNRGVGRVGKGYEQTASWRMVLDWSF
jgi:hypothetical protein